eukprot:s7723_g2.t1
MFQSTAGSSRAAGLPTDPSDVSAQELHRRCWCCGDMAGGRKKERKAQVAKPGKRPSKKAWRKADVEDVEETMEDERLVAKLKKQAMTARAVLPQHSTSENS